MPDTPDQRRAREEEAMRKTLESTRTDDENARREHEAAEGLGAAGIAGLGCLSAAALPFTAGGLVIVGIFAVWAFRGCSH